MGVVTVLGKLSLPFLTAAAFYSTLKLAYDNGTFDRVSNAAWSSDTLLPETNIPLRQKFSGVELLDVFFKSFSCFFYPILSGDLPQLTVQGLHFAGQFVSLWLLVVLEAYRVGISWKPVSFITIFGLLFENIGFAIVLPVWFFVHLILSPAHNRSLSPAIRRTSILVHPAELTVLPWSIFLGGGIPVIMILLTKASTMSPWWASQQVWIGLRMFHPLWTGVAHLLLSVLSSFIADDPEFKSKSKRNKAVLAKLRDVYQLSMNISFITHLITMTLCLAPYFAPSVFAEWVLTTLNLANVFKPTPFWQAEVSKVSSLSEGVLKFLQWDEFIACTAALIWAVTVHRASIGGEGNAPTLSSTLGKAAMYTVIGGPGAATVALIRERDQFMLTESEVTEEKKNT